MEVSAINTEFLFSRNSITSDLAFLFNIFLLASTQKSVGRQSSKSIVFKIAISTPSASIEIKSTPDEKYCRRISLIEIKGTVYDPINLCPFAVIFSTREASKVF